MQIKKTNNGQSILEIVVALAIFSLLGSAMASLAVGGFIGLEQGGEHTEAKLLAQEGIEAVHSVRYDAWNKNIFSTSSISFSGGAWQFTGEGSTETIGQYTRTISFEPVCRNSSDNIVLCPGDYTDLHTKKARVLVEWPVRDGLLNTIEDITYITNWDSVDWTQTDWSGGSGQTTWSDETQYDFDDNIDAQTIPGRLSLESITGVSLVSDSDFEGSTVDTYDWPFSTVENYVYNSSKIEVSGGQAKLKSTGGEAIGDNTLNNNFTTLSSPWVYKDWDQGNNDPNATGSHKPSGGNSGGYVEVNLPHNLKNKLLGGFWEQSFVTTASSPTATCEVDWKVFSATLPPSGIGELFVAVYLDTVPGEPVKGTEVLKKNFTTVFNWESHSGPNAFDCSSKLGAAGTYYYKIAVWAKGKNKNTGPINVGFDNAKVTWQKSIGATYPTDRPTIRPSASFTEAGVLSWNSFTETATKNGGQIYYQLSDDDGVTWKYWNSSAWATASASTNYNTATTINNNIGTFSTVSGKIMFKAFLESNGTQQVILDNIKIGFSPASAAWKFATWDLGGGEVVPIGSKKTSGGNPNGYADIEIPSNAKNNEVGGFWEQKIEVANAGSVLTCYFDWKVFSWDAGDGVDDNKIYVFLDPSSGEPTIGNEIWASAVLSGTTSWKKEAFDCSSSAIVAGTYYLKVAHWLDANNKNTGPIRVGFDNVDVEVADSAYQPSGFLISSGFDMGNASPIQIIEWDEIIPTASYDIKFQIRSATTQAGLSGASWSGPEGKDGDETDFFTTGSGELIHTDHNGDRWVQYKVLLSGDSNDTPILNEVRINYK